MPVVGSYSGRVAQSVVVLNDRDPSSQIIDILHQISLIPDPDGSEPQYGPSQPCVPLSTQVLVVVLHKYSIYGAPED